MARDRHLCKEYQNTTQIATAYLGLAMTRLMLGTAHSVKNSQLHRKLPLGTLRILN